MIVCVEYYIECLDAEKVTWFVGWLRHKHWLEVKFKLCFDRTETLETRQPFLFPSATEDWTTFFSEQQVHVSILEWGQWNAACCSLKIYCANVGFALITDRC